MSEKWPKEYPQNYLLTSGVGCHPLESVAFDAALIHAGISNYNLLKVSSILPKRAVKREQMTLMEGSMLPAAFAKISADEPGTILASAVAVGIPKDTNQVGVIMECARKMSYADRKAPTDESERYGNRDIYNERIGHKFLRTCLEEEVRCMVRDAMVNHGIRMSDVLVSSTSAEVPLPDFGVNRAQAKIVVVSACCLW